MNRDFYLFGEMSEWVGMDQGLAFEREYWYSKEEWLLLK
jgi:hypothetical protein